MTTTVLPSMVIVATDLDRTLFPNGTQPYDGTMPLFCKAVETHRFPLIFVTGRNLRQIEAGIKAYHPPLPDYIIAEVGTKLYTARRGAIVENTDYLDRIRAHTPGWNRAAFHEALTDAPNMRVQEDFNQNRFKCSFYVDNVDRAEKTVAVVQQRITGICEHTQVIFSVDETRSQGLLDILPARANKMEGLEFVREQLGAPKEAVVFCGDSGNDMQPLTCGYRSILVRNAIAPVRREALRRVQESGIPETLYVAKGGGPFNGYYVSGILEGLIHFGILSPDEVSELGR